MSKNATRVRSTRKNENAKLSNSVTKAGGAGRKRASSNPDSSDEEDEFRPPPNPSQNIRKDFAAALTKGAEGNRPFAYSKTHENAPNPHVNVDGFGPLGLPLSPHEARRLISVATQAPFGKNERTIVDKKVRDTWELDASKVRFENSEWNRWLSQTVVPGVEEGLGVKKGTSTAQLYKLLVYETGSHFLSHQDTEKCPGMYASIVITLPSKFEGGALHLSHSGRSTVFDLASSSALSTSVLAWYSDVYHAVKPIVSGYRLALSYNLSVPPSSIVRPTAPPASSVDPLRHVLLSWLANVNKDAPEKIVYHLDHKYSIASLGSGFNALKGTDAQMIDLLRSAIGELPFETYLANIELYQSGQAENDGGYGYSRKRRRGWYNNYDEDSRPHTMAEIDETTFEVKNAVDLKGQPADLDHLNIQEDEDMMPHHLSNGAHDQEEYEGYQGNWGGTMELWYRQTSLVILPGENIFDVLNLNPVRYALKRIEAKVERGWLPRDNRSRHLDTIFKGTDADTARKVMSLLLQAALGTQDADLFVRAVNGCGVTTDLSRLNALGFMKALELFGVEKLHPILDDVLNLAQTNSHRLDLLIALKDNTSVQHAAFIPWLERQWAKATKTLWKCSVADIPTFVQVSGREGLKNFANCILPQIESPELKCDTDFIVPLAKAIHDKWSPHSDAHVQEALRQISSRLMTLAIARQPPIDLANPAQSLVMLKRVLSLAIDLRAFQAFNALLAQVYNTVATCDPSQKLKAVTSLINPLLTYIEELLTKVPQFESGADHISAGYGPLLDLVMESWSTPSNRYVYHHGTPDYRLNDDTAELFVKLLPRLGSIQVVQTKLVPRVDQLAAAKNVAGVQSIAIALVKNRASFDLAAEENAKTFRRLVRHLYSLIVINTNMQLNFRPSAYVSSAYHKEAANLVGVALSIGGKKDSSLLAYLMKHLKPAPSLQAADWFKLWVKPFVVDMKQLLQTHHRDLTMEPFRTFIATNVVQFVQSNIGPPPKETVSIAMIQKVGCTGTCQWCPQLGKFLLGADERISISAKQADRTHMEKELQKAGVATWGITMTTERNRSPHSLVITKPSAMLALGRWRENIRFVVVFLDILGVPETIQAVLGDKLEEVQKALQLIPTPPPAGNHPSRQASQHSTHIAATGSSLHQPSHQGALAPLTAARATASSSSTTVNSQRQVPTSSTTGITPAHGRMSAASTSQVLSHRAAVSVPSRTTASASSSAPSASAVKRPASSPARQPLSKKAKPSNVEVIELLD